MNELIPKVDSKKVRSLFGIAVFVSVGIIWLVPTDAPAAWGWLTIGYVLAFMFCIWFLARTRHKAGIVGSIVCVLIGWYWLSQWLWWYK